MKENIKRIFARDYRHYICIAISLGFLALGFLFPNALPRIGEAFRDLGISFGYYFMELFFPDYNQIQPTVNLIQEWEWAPSPWEPLRLFPWTWEEFQVLWGEYWQLWITEENIQAYLYAISDVLEVVAKAAPPLLLLLVPIWLKARKYTEPREEEEDENTVNVDSKPLARFKRFLFGVLYPVARWIKSFIGFVRENDTYYKFWLFVWLVHFNVISIVVAFFAFYLYFIVTFDLVGIYTQVVKLLLDLTPVIRFIPGVIWFCIGYLVIEYISREAGYAKLEHNERKNRGFLNERGVVTVIYGNMGTGKTRMLTSLALSAEKELRDMALEILLESDMKFPNFPWVNLRKEVERRMDEHLIVDVFSIRRWIRRWKKEYFYLKEHKLLSWYKKKLRRSPSVPDFLFDYDIDHYCMTYNDNLTVSHLFDVVMDYAQAYFVYSIQTSLIFSNYSIRVDLDVTDYGHFPFWNDDFFRRKPQYMHLYSRYCHIIDFDMLRLGKRMLDENPNRNALGFGVYVVSEIDKERKNELQLRKQKSSTRAAQGAEECTQDNDLFNACLKMIRHATVIANRVFVKVLCDLQRPEDWGAGGREVGEIVFIDDKDEKMPTLPLISPYWIIHALYRVHSAFEKFFLKYMVAHDDNTLLVYLLHNLTAVYTHYIDRTEKLFGCQTFNLEVESGRMDGKVKLRKFYGMDKKDFSGRYSTDAMSSIFDLPNTVSPADFAEYADVMATKAERDKQNSHFQNDINRSIAV